MKRSRLLTLAGAVSLAAVLPDLGHAEEAPAPEEQALTAVADEVPDLYGSAGLRDLALRLNARQSAIERREQGLVAREADLRAVEERLIGRMAELTAIRTEIGAQLEEADAETIARRDGLVKMFEGMRSKDAAAVVGKLDAGLATDVLDAMNRTKAGKVLAAMPPAAAANLAEKMARPVTLEST